LVSSAFPGTLSTGLHLRAVAVRGSIRIPNGVQAITTRPSDADPACDALTCVNTVQRKPKSLLRTPWNHGRRQSVEDRAVLLSWRLDIAARERRMARGAA
jgi:hypothetical protein